MTSKNNKLLRSLKNYIERERHSFHTPGHKAGAGFEKKFAEFVRKNIFSLDITVTPFVDSIHEPKRGLKSAMERISALYGVKNSFFLVNGSTQGNLAAFLSFFADGDTVLISRNIHRSVISACVLSGIYPVWMNPKILKNGVICEVGPREVEEYLRFYPEVKGVFITSPTYNGAITDVKKIAEVCQKFGKILIVDEAWGAHLKFARNFVSAVDYADCVIHSFHKIFPVFSQGSVVHFRRGGEASRILERTVSLLNTTSPFYPMLLTMEYAADILERKGDILTEKMLSLGKLALRNLKKITGIELFSNDHLPRGFEWDPSKLTIATRARGLSGFFVQKFLFDKGVGVDCATPLNVIATLGFGNTKDDILALVSAVADLPKRKTLPSPSFPFPSTPSEIVLSPREVYTKYKKKKIRLDRSAGQSAPK
ncbi:MAG: aminotransferase class I/II-fold pyridoxal phosphate-dependent enzyme [Elusimicrobia bacterium]|nr:aminotransferase class I/II-fold pyridoxal phosphate-dependent enzyme [Elusimicrobiota bacterium]